jgi:hypothetical protein
LHRDDDPDNPDKPGKKVLLNKSSHTASGTAGKSRAMPVAAANGRAVMAYHAGGQRP